MAPIHTNVDVETAIKTLADQHNVTIPSLREAIVRWAFSQKAFKVLEDEGLVRVGSFNAEKRKPLGREEDPAKAIKYAREELQRAIKVVQRYGDSENARQRLINAKNEVERLGKAMDGQTAKLEGEDTSNSAKVLLAAARMALGI